MALQSLAFVEKMSSQNINEKAKLNKKKIT